MAIPEVVSSEEWLTDERQFFDLIRAAGILIRLRTTHQDKVSG
ncbi:MAG TPA: hypothetical protein VGS60_18635 [Actinomycetes bacterium]|jgi:hypothetical protein|nr:hypothetical protein [Actinomycetes bacterium]